MLAVWSYWRNLVPMFVLHSYSDPVVFVKVVLLITIVPHPAFLLSIIRAIFKERPTWYNDVVEECKLDPHTPFSGVPNLTDEHLAFEGTENDKTKDHVDIRCAIAMADFTLSQVKDIIEADAEADLWNDLLLLVRPSCDELWCTMNLIGIFRVQCIVQNIDGLLVKLISWDRHQIRDLRLCQNVNQQVLVTGSSTMSSHEILTSMNIFSIALHRLLQSP